MRTWAGQINFSAVPLDDFKVILGVDLLGSVDVHLTTSIRVMCIFDKGSPCMIPVEHQTKKPRVEVVSALQLVRSY